MEQASKRYLLFASALLAACDPGGSGLTGPDDPPDIRQFVTGAAAENLNSQGLFTLAQPVAPDTIPIITEQRARDLAASFVRSFGPSLKPYWEKERGRSIDLRDLKADARVFYASTPYELFPEGFHSAFRRAFGPFYVVRMNAGSRAVVMVAVSAYATEVEIDSEGFIQRPVHRGMEFVSQAVPVDTTSLLYLSPEQAVARVGRLTGARVSEVPELMRLEMRWSPLSAVWKLSLDRPVRVRTVQDSRVVEVQELYVGPEGGRRLMIPAQEQPREFMTTAVRIGPAGEDLGFAPVHVQVKPGVPTVFEEVVVESK